MVCSDWMWLLIMSVNFPSHLSIKQMFSLIYYIWKLKSFLFSSEIKLGKGYEMILWITSIDSSVCPTS